MLSLEIESIDNYIAQSFGLPTKSKIIRQTDELPLYLKSSFTFSKGEIAGKDILWAKLVNDSGVPPDRLQKQKFQLEQFFQVPVVFVFDKLDSWDRKRLIEKKVGFVQLGKQVYIPEMLLQLSDVRNKHRIPDKLPGSLSFPAQAAVLSHLQRESLNGRSSQQIVATLAYSAMTVTRIIRELQQSDLISIHPGKEKLFNFNESGKDLWLRALPLLRNPVKEEWFSYGPIGTSKLFEAGETALAHYSMLAESRIMHLAIGKEQFRSLRTLKRLPELIRHQGNYRLEVWNYDPGIVVGSGHDTIDKLSLYLSMASTQDERALAALDEMINQIVW